MTYDLYIIYICDTWMIYKTLFFRKIVNIPRARQKGKGIYSSVCPTSSDGVPVIRPRSCEQRAEPITDAARLGLFHFGGCQASWLKLLYNRPECSDLVHGCEDDLIPLLLKAAVLMKARLRFPSDGPFSHLIHYWSEWGSFFAHDRSGYISSPVAFQSSHKPCSLTAVTYYPNRIYVTLWGADSRREKRGRS